MKRVLVGDDFFETIIDTIPIPIFVADKEVRILGYNSASIPLFENEDHLLMMECGDAFNCINSKSASNGCGAGDLCKKCVIRNSVNKSYSGSRVEKAKTKMKFVRGDESKEIQMLVTTAPLKLGDNLYVLVMLEDVTELMELRGLLPICSYCKKIRDDKEYWQGLENFLQKNFNLLFSHGICPECAERLEKETQL